MDFHDSQSLWLFPAEGQQLASQFCRASCREKIRLLKSCAMPPASLPDGVRLLRLYELSFKTQAFGEIAPVGDKVSDLTVGVADREMLSST